MIPIPDVSKCLIKDTQVGDEHIKILSEQLVIRKCRFKTTMKQSDTRISKIKNNNTKLMRIQNNHTLFMGL